MVFDQEFIWYQDHYAYHLTRKEYMKEIIEKGLRPRCGARSESVGDIRKAIYFYDYLYSTEDWIERLYENKNRDALELLRFNLKRRKWKVQCIEIGDFYVLHPVLPEKIEYAVLYDEEGKKVSLDSDFYKVKVLWKPLFKYNQVSVEGS